ncbi:MAG: DUF475 domain-containing protein [Candidatus Gracilibacteria bacterium]|nr:DUF475 domain-containing protein [Candidatus Gracilibacteria bacterium]MDD5179592.1 DUF475 domain-containing protein [Candidatus Gracilibacteria bacterium]
MSLFTITFTIVGLALFETISSIDNAIINAEVLTTMGAKARKWFLSWGIIFAVVGIRGLLPWLIVWIATPSLGPIEALTATFSSDPTAANAIEASAPYLLIAGGTFFILLFLHWLFLETKSFGLPGEKFFAKFGTWFFAAASIFLAVIVWEAIHRDALLAFAAVVGSTAFFITHGFKEQAAKQEERLLHGDSKSIKSDFAKLLYLEVIDATFSIDGVIGAFAFTMAVPLILLGNGIGALVVRQLTVASVEKIKRYPYLKNGAMYSVLFLGVIMLADSFGMHIPEWISPLATVVIVGYFLLLSIRAAKMKQAV